ncbi:hypothetical protein MSAN_02032800 [Mycena sanguinolenta]|uniref:Uncharacterized protein n=1 Tax=Mycena sanguinolenta TaxID=230812 RepID=A0A8H6XJS6_9AGAR|nr:hypothetical protein MSAN_02032800 [Mycena sanguinolenta]
MSLRARLSRTCDSCNGLFPLIAFCVIFGALMLFPFIQQSVAKQKKLRSLITDNTPISGFYGPGSWWAWLITLGMTHGHLAISFFGSDEPSQSGEWDYDLMGASGYIVAAAVDLTLKTRAIAQLGDSICDSPLLPALFCAENVISIGTGSSLFTLLTGTYIGGSFGRRRAAIATIPVVFALIASWFIRRAHIAISTQEPQCQFPDGSALLSDDSPTTLVEVPVFLIIACGTNVVGLYTYVAYWLVAGVISAVLTALILVPNGALYLAIALPIAGSILFCLAIFAFIPGFGTEVLQLYTTYGAYWAAAAVVSVVLTVTILASRRSPYLAAFSAFVAGPVLFPLMILTLILAVALPQWLAATAIFWAIVYIPAFFPQTDFFPATGMSALVMDQLAAFLGVGCIAAFRIGRRIYKAMHNRAVPDPASTDEYELVNSP